MSQTSSTEKPDPATTYVKGLEGVVAAQTGLSFVDGKGSKLYYVGIPVHEFVGASSFEEVTYLLWNRKLPSASELQDFKKELVSQRKISAGMIQILEGIEPKAHPMAVLRTAVSYLATEDPHADDNDLENSQRKALWLTAKIPTILAAFARLREGKDVVDSDESLSHAANFLYTLTGKKPTAEMEKALDTYLILLADHGLNASTFSARVTIATQSDMYSAVTSAIGTLKGDLHGCAVQRAMEMLLEIGSPDNTEKYILDALANKKKIMGFGHRIYKEQDPRAVAFKEVATNLAEKSGQTKWMEISNIVQKIVWEKKKIPTNVDFYSSSVLYTLQIPIDFFTTIFGMSRVVGWTAHIIEQQSDNRLIRPKAEYTGPRDQHYTPLEKRS